MGSTQHFKTNGIGLSPKEQQRRIAALRYLLLVKGTTQRQAAQYLNLAPKTVCQWVKTYGIRKELDRRDLKRTLTALKLDDSLSAFSVYVRIHHKHLFEQLEPALKTFINPF